MAGHMVAQYLMEQGEDVTGFARQKSSLWPTYMGDARNFNDLKKVILQNSYDYIVNCIGILNRCIDEKVTDGILLNSVLPHYLADLVEKQEAKLIHISTDCVFKGSKGGYCENDFPDDTTLYGMTKALGEVIDEKNLTLRTSIVGPELKENGTGLFHWFMNQKDYVYGYQRTIWTGVTTLQLAKVIAEDKYKRQTGLYHLVNNQVISKYKLLCLFNKYCRKVPIRIIDDTNYICDKSLRNTLKEPVFQIPSYKQMIMEMADWIEKHPEIYPLYLNQDGARL